MCWFIFHLPLYTRDAKLVSLRFRPPFDLELRMIEIRKLCMLNYVRLVTIFYFNYYYYFFFYLYLVFDLMNCHVHIPTNVRSHYFESDAKWPWTTVQCSPQNGHASTVSEDFETHAEYGSFTFRRYGLKKKVGDFLFCLGFSVIFQTFCFLSVECGWTCSTLDSLWSWFPGCHAADKQATHLAPLNWVQWLCNHSHSNKWSNTYLIGDKIDRIRLRL